MKHLQGRFDWMTSAVDTNEQSWVEDNCQEPLIPLPVNDMHAFRLQVKHPTKVLQLSSLSKEYWLLYLVLFLSLRWFYDNFKCQNHAWKHKMSHLGLDPIEDARMFDNPAESYLKITPFAQLIHFLLHSCAWNAWRNFLTGVTMHAVLNLCGK